MKRATLLAILLLTSVLAFGQKFQDVTAKGSPVSLSVKADIPGMRSVIVTTSNLEGNHIQGEVTEVPGLISYVAVHNNSSKGVVALVAVTRTTDALGHVLPGRSTMDYAFKNGVLAPQEDRIVMPIDAADPDSTVKQVEGAVLFLQFDDGSTWGDPEAAKEMLAARPQKLAFLTRLVETYNQSGEAAFTAALNDPTLGRPERSVAGCLEGDAEHEKIATIELAKKRFAAALQWRALGIL